MSTSTGVCWILDHSRLESEAHIDCDEEEVVRRTDWSPGWNFIKKKVVIKLKIFHANKKSEGEAKF